jgi:hypothetical protein
MRSSSTSRLPESFGGGLGLFTFQLAGLVIFRIQKILRSSSSSGMPDHLGGRGGGEGSHETSAAAGTPKTSPWKIQYHWCSLMMSILTGASLGPRFISEIHTKNF